VVVYRQDRRRRLTLVLLVITSLVLISLDERGSAVLDSVRSAAQDVISPIQGLVDDVVNPAADFFDSLGRADELEDVNARLRSEIAGLRAQLETGKAALVENAELKAALDIPQIEDWDGVVASVVSGSVDNFHRTWRIDKGADAGIEIDMPVVVGGDGAAALVGRVKSVASNRAIVERIDDRSFSAGAQLVQLDGAPGPVGSVHGIPDSRLLSFDLFDNSDPGLAIDKGQLVTTANEGSKFPPDLAIGTVRRSVPATAAVARNTRVEPLVSLDTVEIVKILRSPPTSGSPDEGRDTTG
jgi:rod shape-determining protein MreC